MYIIIIITTSILLLIVVACFLGVYFYPDNEVYFNTSEFVDIQVENFKVNNKIVDKFDGIPIYVINMDKSKKRWKIISEQADILGIKLNRFRAITSEDLQTAKYKRIKQDNISTRSYLKRQIDETIKACCYSHIYLAKYLLENTNHESCIILEDDVYLLLSLFWDGSIKDNIRHIPDDWECIQLSAVDGNRNLKKNQYYKTELSGTQSYMLNRKGMMKIVDTWINKNLTCNNCGAEHFVYNPCIAYRIPSLFIENNELSTLWLDGDDEMKRRSHMQKHVVRYYMPAIKKINFPGITLVGFQPLNECPFPYIVTTKNNLPNALSKISTRFAIVADNVVFQPVPLKSLYEKLHSLGNRIMTSDVNCNIYAGRTERVRTFNKHDFENVEIDDARHFLSLVHGDFNTLDDGRVFMADKNSLPCIIHYPSNRVLKKLRSSLEHWTLY